MKHARAVSIVLLLVSIPLLLDPPGGDACGLYVPEAQFVFRHNPGPEFLRGELGIVEPEYYRRNLVVAYRYLSGRPLTAEEIKALSPQPPQIEPWRELQVGGPAAAARWLAARNAVPGVQKLVNIEVYRRTLVDGYYTAYQNCLEDAFDAAAATLANRSARWGANSAQTAEWLRGQDQVFANCGTRMPERPVKAAAEDQPHLPAELPAGTNALLLADRQYQTAAAFFYSGKYADAEQGFRAVAANAGSPWRESAAYLAARALIRKGTVDGDKDSLVSAEKALRDIVNDPQQTRWRQPARGLLDFVRSHLYPEERMVELGDALSKPGLGSGIERAVTDYTALWDRLQRGPAERSEMADWITTFQGINEQHAVDRWRKGGGTAWLVAALKETDPATPELIAEARKARPDSPAYATLAYYGIQLQIVRNQREAARAWADEALAAKLPLSAQNAFREERMSLARNWTEFLRYAPRSPVAEASWGADERLEPSHGAVTLDHDATGALNHHVHLELWIDASANRLLPSRLQAQIAQAGWVRAVLLNRAAEAGALARRVAELQPDLAAAMRGYVAEKSPEAAHFAAVFLMLRTPGLTPVVRGGFGRERQTGQLGGSEDNWWRLGIDWDTTASFLPEAQRAAGEKEWEALAAAASTGPNYLSAAALAWARTHPDDPRVPEALHLIVRATHYGPTDPGTTSSYSRQAFRLLHSRYPRSQWAQKTKYWY
jgi:hypothetical protein